MNKLLQGHLEQTIIDYLGTEQHFVWKPVGGGSINTCYRISGGHSQFFVKTNDSSVFKNGFLEEKQGLEFLKNNGVEVPEIIKDGSFKNKIYLILKWVESGTKTVDFWHNLAEQLTILHQKKNKSFGLDYSNYMGQLIQSNAFESTFVNFFIKNRLKPQVKLAFDNSLLRKKQLQSFEKLYLELPSIFPKEKPTAVHGDLWSGNYICAASNTAVFIDPAVYYGHREVDLAMTLLFGGFSPEFYQYYDELFPIEPDLNKRVDFYNLYPLLIHLNLFGSSYFSQIDSIVSQF